MRLTSIFRLSSSCFFLLSVITTTVLFTVCEGGGKEPDGGLKQQICCQTDQESRHCKPAPNKSALHGYISYANTKKRSFRSQRKGCQHPPRVCGEAESNCVPCSLVCLLDTAALLCSLTDIWAVVFRCTEHMRLQRHLGHLGMSRPCDCRLTLVCS